MQKQQLFIENMMEYDEWKNSNIIINNYQYFEIISIFRINLDNIHVTIYHILYISFNNFDTFYRHLKII